MSGFTDDLERIAKEVNGSKKSETMIRQLTTAREALGKTILDALANPAVTEVYRNPNYDGDPDGGIVWVLTLGEPKRVLCRLSEEKAMRVITTFAGAARIVINADSPLMSTEAVLDGSRFTASIPPAIVGGCQFNIRKKATKRFPLDDYMAKNIITVEQCQLLRQMIAERKNIVVAGGTGSGKTTMQKLVDQYGSDASEVYQRQMAEMQGRNPSVGAFDAGATQMPETPYATSVQPVAMGQGGGGGRGNSLAAFDGDESRWFLDSRMDIPGKFVLRAGGVIPAILLSGINSDLPGQILAQVSQDVYDTATGRYLLIPQGTRLIGAYSSEVIYGQNRVFAAWQRLIFPDGRAYDIGSQPATTGAGYAGLRDRVNMHFMRVFGSALLMSAIVGGISYSQDDTSTSGSYGDGEASRNNALSSTMSEALGQQLGQVTVEMIRRNMNIAPTLEVRPGFRMNVMLVKDVQFRREYKAFDYSYANR